MPAHVLGAVHVELASFQLDLEMLLHLVAIQLAAQAAVDGGRALPRLAPRLRMMRIAWMEAGGSLAMVLRRMRLPSRQAWRNKTAGGCCDWGWIRRRRRVRASYMETTTSENDFTIGQNGESSAKLLETKLHFEEAL